MRKGIKYVISFVLIFTMFLGCTSYATYAAKSTSHTHTYDHSMLFCESVTHEYERDLAGFLCKNGLYYHDEVWTVYYKKFYRCTKCDSRSYVYDAQYERHAYYSSNKVDRYYK